MPSHRDRLPVSKPRSDRRFTSDEIRNVDDDFVSQNVERSSSDDTSTPPAGPHSTETNAAASQARSTKSTAAEKKLKWRGSRTDAAHPQPNRTSSEIPMAMPLPVEAKDENLDIAVEQVERRAFELGDILTRDFMARNSSFLISLAFHTLVLLLLSFVLMHSSGKARILLELLSSPDVEEFEGIIAQADISISDMDDLVAATDEDPFNAAFGDGDGDQIITDDDSTSGVAGNGEMSQGKGDGKSAKFFGMRALGNKFVYVLDHSGSMAYESADVSEYRVSRFDVARLELINSVDSLRPHQEFYVVLFSGQTEQMFNQNALIPQAVKATPENKARLKEWLWRDKAQGGTDPRDGLKLAFKMSPDAIFMLSDGEFRDEKKDGKPLAIDITRQQATEKSAIKVNSIAFEDENSKTNLEELSSVSGGQFKFVRVKDYITQMATSPADFFRARMPSAAEIQQVVDWKERKQLAERLIKTLRDGTPDDRKSAEATLHEMTYWIFDSSIPSIADEDAKLGEVNSALKAWEEVWTQADAQTNLDGSTAVGLFSNLANSKDFVRTIQSLRVADMPPTNQIVVARGIVDFQHRSGRASPETKKMLAGVLGELNKEAKAKFNEERFIKTASVATCRKRLETVLKNRRLRANRIYGKTKNKSITSELREAFGKELIELYPETSVAKKAAKEFNLTVSVEDSTE